MCPVVSSLQDARAVSVDAAFLTGQLLLKQVIRTHLPSAG